ncbi:N-acetylneuraminate synthase [Desulforhopalus sp. 52FAK]
MNNIYIIAEAGVNHNGDSELAFELVDAAVDAGADAVKFQTFKAEELVTRKATKAIYQQQGSEEDESQFTMLKGLELSYDIHHDLLAYCKIKNIDFLSTAFDLDSLSFLANDLGLKTLKIPSGEITNGPLVLAYALTGCELLVSTGMTTLEEIEEALGVISFGFLQCGQHIIKPSCDRFRQAYRSTEGLGLLKKKVKLLHCTTEYPAPDSEINLKAMQTLRDVFGLKTGYSDHSAGLSVPVAAAAAGAVLIEKHFTLDKSLPGPDHRASLEPNELREMVSRVRRIEKILGDEQKKPSVSEVANMKIARKSLVAGKGIKAGEIFTKNNVAIKRPGDGLSPMNYWELLGTRSLRSYDKDDLIDNL